MNLESFVTRIYLESRLQARFAELSARVDANFRIQNRVLGTIVAAVLLPYLERLLVH